MPPVNVDASARPVAYAPDDQTHSLHLLTLSLWRDRTMSDAESFSCASATNGENDASEVTA